MIPSIHKQPFSDFPMFSKTNCFLRTKELLYKGRRLKIAQQLEILKFQLIPGKKHVNS